MPYELTNRLRGPSTIRITGASSTGALALADFRANATIETVNSLIVTSIKFSLLPSTGTLTITRNSLVVATLYGSGDWKHDELAIANTATGTMTVDLVGGGTAMISVKKDCTYSTDLDKI